MLGHVTTNIYITFNFIIFILRRRVEAFIHITFTCVCIYIYIYM